MASESRRIIYVLLLMIAVASAGCTGIGDGDDTSAPDNDTEPAEDPLPTGGLTVDFSTASSSYNDGETATFIVNLENTGEFEARNIRMTLFGANWASEVGPGERQFRRVSGLDPQGGETTSTRRTFSRSIDTALGSDESDTYDVGLTTTYDYRAKTRGKLSVMSQSYFDEQDAVRGEMDYDASAAPVQIKMSGESPYPSGGNSDIVIPLMITNTGDGSVQDDTIQLDVFLEGGPDLSGCSGQKRLENGQKEVHCTIRTDMINLNDLPEKSFTLIAEGSYTYVVNRETGVSVSGN